MKSKRTPCTPLRFSLLWALLLGAAGFMSLAQNTSQTTSQATPAIPTTTVQDTIYTATGAPAAGTVLISWPAFTISRADQTSPPARTSTSPWARTACSACALTPNAGSNPVGSYYTVIYHLSRRLHHAPVLGHPVPPGRRSDRQGERTVQNSVLPASVAHADRDCKSYVDQAIAAAVTGTPQDSSPYVEKSGDTMTGPLVLPGDPVAPLQAADMNYVDEQVAALAAGARTARSALQPQATQVIAQPRRHAAPGEQSERRALRQPVPDRCRRERHRQRGRKPGLRQRL